MEEFVQLNEVADKYVKTAVLDFNHEYQRATSMEEKKVAYHKAKENFSEGLFVLNKLKLTPLEKNGISHFRKFLKEAIRACKAGSSGKEEKAHRIMEKARAHEREYEAILRRIGASLNG